MVAPGTWSRPVPAASRAAANSRSVAISRGSLDLGPTVLHHDVALGGGLEGIAVAATVDGAGVVDLHLDVVAGEHVGSEADRKALEAGGIAAAGALDDRLAGHGH